MTNINNNTSCKKATSKSKKTKRMIKINNFNKKQCNKTTNNNFKTDIYYLYEYSLLISSWTIHRNTI